MSKNLNIVIKIPKKRIKNANASMNHMVSAAKTAWIRDNTFEIWKDTIHEQLNITAVEPTIETVIELKEETVETLKTLEELKEKIEEAKAQLKKHESEDSEYKQYKKERGILLRKKDKDTKKIAELSEKIDEYDKVTNEIKSTIRRRTQTWRNVRNKEMPKVKKDKRSVETQNRRRYIEAKIEANKFQHIFDECFVVIKVHNITNRDFDAPNFYPTVKAIIDAGTDTGVLWEDDNNRIIKSMIFLPGKNIDRDNYVFDINIVSDINSMTELIEENKNE